MAALLGRRGILELAEAGSYALRQVPDMLSYGCPTFWVLDCCLEEANDEIHGRARMRDYITARLRRDGGLLVDEGLLGEAEVRALEDGPSRAARAALRAASLLRAREDLLSTPVKEDEGRRARSRLMEVSPVA
jgi:hypothetical protein